MWDSIRPLEVNFLISVIHSYVTNQGVTIFFKENNQELFGSAVKGQPKITILNVFTHDHNAVHVAPVYI